MGSKFRTGASRIRSVVLLWLVPLSMTPSLLAGVGEKNLFPPRVLGVGEEPVGIVTSDLDRDGRLDLVVASGVSDYAYVLYGKGAGVFDIVRLPTGLARKGVAIADLDEDGTTDIVLSSGFGISVYLGTGGRTFAEEVLYQNFNGPLFDAIAVADFDLDGHIDVVNGGSFNWVHLGNGDGTLSFAPKFERSQGATYFIEVGDFNEDGAPDFVADGTDANVWLGNGDGTFVGGLKGIGGFDAVVHDFDKDGHQDFAVAGGSDIRIHFGDGQGQFSAPVSYDGFLATSVTLADLNNDGKQDLVANSGGISGVNVSPEVSVLLSNGDGTFAPAVGYAAPLLGGRLTSGDFDCDGKIDVVSTSLHSITGSDPVSKGLVFQDPGLAFILSGDGQGGLVPGRVEYFGDTLNTPVTPVVGDFNNDGLQDLATANFRSDDVSVLLGDGTGSFVEQTPVPVGTAPASLVIGYFDPGTDEDLAVANLNSSDVTILLGNGDGTFVPSAPIALGRGPTILVQADINADGKQDLVTANRSSGDLSILIGHGDGTFDSPTLVEVGGAPRSIAVVDLDEQAGLDLAVVATDLLILLGNGDGTFREAISYPTGIGALTVAAADFDNDGHADLVVGGFGETTAVALYGNGQGTVSAPAPVDLTASVLTVAVDDLDGDGRQDLLFTHTVPMVTVLRGVDGGFGSRLESAAGGGLRVAVGEFNRDGRLDLVVTHFNSLGILLNHGPVFVKFQVDTTTLSWPKLVGYHSFNVYRGDLSGLQDHIEDGYPDSGYGLCRNDLDVDLTDNLFVDDEDPDPGAGFFYVMSRVRDDLESDLGETSTGLPRVPSILCGSQAGQQPVPSRYDDASPLRRKRRQR